MPEDLESEGMEIREKEIDLSLLFETFLEEEDPQTTHMVLFRVCEILLNRSPGRLTQDLLKSLVKAGDAASRARLELDPDLSAQHESRFEQRKIKAYEIAASAQEF